MLRFNIPFKLQAIGMTLDKRSYSILTIKKVGNIYNETR